MDRDKLVRPYQLAIMAFLTSMISAAAVVFALKRRGVLNRPRAGSRSDAEAPQSEAEFGAPSAAVTSPNGSTSQTPDEFSEDMIVPGFIERGTEVVRDIDEEGRSPEGV